MVTLSVSPDRVSEDAGSTRVTVTGSLNSAARDSDTPVTISVEDGTAIAGTDFASVSDFTLTIPANEMRGTATFNLVVRHSTAHQNVSSHVRRQRNAWNRDVQPSGSVTSQSSAADMGYSAQSSTNHSTAHQNI